LCVAKDQEIARLTAERDALRGKDWGDYPVSHEAYTTCLSERDALQAKLEAAGSAVDHVDLMIDEFKRIKSCPEVTQEIVGLCDRAIARTSQNVPVIVQRDDAQKQIAALTAMLEKSVTLDVWQMTVREFERTIASLTAEREAAHADVRKFKENCCDSCRKILDQG
jgi:hypothetical protein